MSKLLRVLMRVLSSDRLYAVAGILSFADTPTNRIDRHGSVTPIYGRNAHMLFCRSAIPGEDKPNSRVGLQTNRFRLARQLQGHDHSGECCYSSQPSADSVPYFNLLIECHGISFAFAYAATAMIASLVEFVQAAIDSVTPIC